MQLATFNAFCPFEVGDNVINQHTRRIHTITDIACIHYVKAGTVMFLYELDNSGRYVRIQQPDDGAQTQQTGQTEPEFAKF